MPKNYTALKLPKIDFWSKFQRSISNRSRDIASEKKRSGWMDGWMDKSKLIDSLLACFAAASLKTMTRNYCSLIYKQRESKIQNMR